MTELNKKYEGQLPVLALAAILGVALILSLFSLSAYAREAESGGGINSGGGGSTSRTNDSGFDSARDILERQSGGHVSGFDSPRDILERQSGIEDNHVSGFDSPRDILERQGLLEASDSGFDSARDILERGAGAVETNDSRFDSARDLLERRADLFEVNDSGFDSPRDIAERGSNSVSSDEGFLRQRVRELENMVSILLAELQAMLRSGQVGRVNSGTGASSLAPAPSAENLNSGGSNMGASETGDGGFSGQDSPRDIASAAQLTIVGTVMSPISDGKFLVLSGDDLITVAIDQDSRIANHDDGRISQTSIAANHIVTVTGEVIARGTLRARTLHDNSLFASVN